MKEKAIPSRIAFLFLERLEFLDILRPNDQRN